VIIRTSAPSIVYTIETNMRRSLPEAETRSFLTFAQAKSSMASELDRHAGGYAQLGNETGVRMIGAFSPA
jgi:hypothetical protein